MNYDGNIYILKVGLERNKSIFFFFMMISSYMSCYWNYYVFVFQNFPKIQGKLLGLI